MATATKDAPPSTAPPDGAASTPGTDAASSPGLDAGAAGPFKYDYMFEKNKSPTKQLDAILRAMARFIVRPARTPLTASVGATDQTAPHRPSTSATGTRFTLRPRSWLPFTRLSAATMTVRLSRHSSPFRHDLNSN